MVNFSTLLQEDLDYQINLILALMSVQMKEKRCRASPSQIKTLYALYIFSKNCWKKKYKVVSPGKNLLCKISGVGYSQLTAFINSEKAAQFMTIKRNCYNKGSGAKSNEYKLHNWVILWFRFFEMHGMMKGFQKDFSQWKKTFEMRVFKWIIPKIYEGLTLEQIHAKKGLSNKLYTENNLKSSEHPPLKSSGIKLPSEGSYKAKGFYKEHEGATSIHEEVEELSSTLRERFHISWSSLKKFLRYNSLIVIKLAIDLMELWVKRGMQIQCSDRVLQSCINRVNYQKAA